MTEQEIIDYLISALTATQTLVNYNSEASNFIGSALSIFDEDAINQATIETGMGHNPEQIRLVKFFITEFSARHKNVVENGKLSLLNVTQF